jgi:two-component system, LytTR family, sensor kinase
MPTYGGILIVESNIEKLSVFRNRWVYHTLFWLLYYIAASFLYYNLTATRSLRFYLELFSFIVSSMGIVYLNLYLFIPKLLFRKKYLEYVLVLLLFMCSFSALNILLQKFYFAHGEILFAATSQFNLPNMFVHTFEQIYLLGLTTSIKLAKDWMRNQQLMKEKEKQYLEAELNFLKTQIQPHFFFNTLNNLYSLTLKKSDQAPEIVLKLSDLMSYMLYESNAPKVPLAKEIDYLQNYLEVEKLRFGHRLSVSFKVEGETSHLAIPPMILILFLENSFKHGVKNNLQQVDIEINLEVDDKFLYFKVANPVSEFGEIAGNNGIGLKNVRRRLQLLFGEDFMLDTEVWNKTYIVSLKIPVWQTT